MSSRIFSLPVVALSVVAGVLNALYWTGRQFADDWASLWIAGTLVRTGNAEHIYDADPIDFAVWSGPAWGEVIASGEFSPAPHPFVHLPGVAYALAPFTGMISFDVSVVILTILCGVSLPILVSASWSLWTRHAIPLPALLGLSVAAWYSTAFQIGSILGQTSPLIICLTICGIALARERPVLGGILLGLAGAVKLTPLGLIPLMLIFRRYRKCAAVTALTAAVALGFSLLTGGIKIFGAWLDRLGWISDHLVVAPPNGSLGSVILRDVFLEGQAGAPGVANAPTWLSIVPLLVGAILFVGIVWAAWRSRRWAEPLVLVGAYTIATMASSIMWNHYLLVCVPLVTGTVLFARRLVQPVRQALMILCCLAALLLFPPLNAQAGVEAPTVGVLLPWADLVALVSLIALLAIAAGLVPAYPEARRRETGGSGAAQQVSGRGLVSGSLGNRRRPRSEGQDPQGSRRRPRRSERGSLDSQRDTAAERRPAGTDHRRTSTDRLGESPDLRPKSNDRSGASPDLSALTDRRSRYGMPRTQREHEDFRRQDGAAPSRGGRHRA